MMSISGLMMPQTAGLLVMGSKSIHKIPQHPVGGAMTEFPKTKEPQYSIVFEAREKHGISRFGLMANESWNQDPRRTLFTLARYKFVAKMLAGRKNVLEVGCADAFATRIVQQTVGSVTATDFDPVFIADVKERMNSNWPLDARVHNMINGPVPGSFDAAYALDVLEHIQESDEDKFIGNTVASLNKTGIVIFGIPSLESQHYASPQSKAGHVNCKSGDALKQTLDRYFHTVFVFSMNDEVVHTGFYPMAHYLLGVGCHRRD
jgi:2-polyprenyl-3-methyl-5-hydroxy-6-metoxy-1,4-benzoquinol methylase